ncbi:asparagine synthase C-terminal domain-containing protein [Sphingomonas sp. HF-S4]|uniref:asparagine synthase (glutamine-hydrolyzing) n=1 Tax=Sphingomonas agrestis TaxID=3080540 RepID=A0ABU3Y3A4_9SPHN|nr:asparagine synthase C-terminal domain-containing protein [Sphingomonas sp. HF-S4]MDV3455854.1 asparagine synthase C-terminal domain-containing protein [Sphingomonas sp. HF-S4]
MTDPRWAVAMDRDETLAFIGVVFDREGLSDAGARDITLGPIAALSDGALVRCVWGNYVAIRRLPGRPGLSVVRDPGGGLAVVVAEAGDSALAAPCLPRWLRDAAGIAPPIDTDALAAALANPLLLTHRSMLHGIHVLPAGHAVDLVGAKPGRSRALWPPGEILHREAEDPQGPETLRAAVTGCVRALASRHKRLTVELSGGLDSAIVLGALASEGRTADLSCVNFAVAHAGGDERSEARAVADRWQARLVEVTAAAETLRFQDVLCGEQPVEPVLYGLDVTLERASIGVARAFDASAIFTGQGGDAVFFNLPTAPVAVDYARAVGWRALWSRVAYHEAQRSYRSLWHVQGRILRDRFGGTRRTRYAMPGSQLGRTAVAAGEHDLRHPWLHGDEGMPPARRMQFEAIANCQHFYGPTWRSSAAALVHPLLAQPVVEACLAIPAWRLTHGSGNRALARELFGDWLPEVVRNRRNKGEATNYYRRAIVENLPWLRDFLLGGVLVAHGLLDGPGIDAALRDTSLIWTDQSRMIAVYASFEAWARYWGLSS